MSLDAKIPSGPLETKWSQYKSEMTLVAPANKRRYTVIVVTHELGLAAEFADQIVLMHRGKCLRVGTPAEVYQQDLLEHVFEAPLEVGIGPEGRPHVQIQGRRNELPG